MLVRIEKRDEQVFIESAVGVRYEGPGDAVHPRQAGEVNAGEHRQVIEVAARQAVVNLFELCRDDVEVVEEPFASGAHVLAGALLLADVAVRLAQHRNVVAQPRKELGGAGVVAHVGVAFTEAAAVLRETLCAEDFGSYGRFE